MRMVFLDTAPVIYLVEGTDEKRELVRNQLLAWVDNGAAFGASALTLMELLIHPKKTADVVMQSRYRSLLSAFVSGAIMVIDDTVAEKAAEYRARLGLRAPDALQIACAVVNGYDTFYTNDRKLRQIKDIKVVLVE